jgi:two-component system cell cycle response regulator
VKPFDDDDSEKTNVSRAMGDVIKELMGRSQRDRAYLIVLAGSNVGEMFRLEAGESVIGRGTAAKVKLGDDGISRKHARIVVDGQQVRIEDLGSANGTLVNGERINLLTLKDGDKIQLGSTTILKFTYHDKLEENFQRAMYDAALRDDLTKAFNKKHFLDRLEQEVAYAKRHAAPLSMLMFDVDHFKTTSWPSWPRSPRAPCARRTSSAATAARSSPSFAAASPCTTPPPSPSGCASWSNRRSSRSTASSSR